jgi:hypothetical protein
MYRVALIGSSGGGGATISSGESIIQSINHQLSLIKSSNNDNNVVALTDVLLIVSSTGLDFKNTSTIASLWVVDDDGALINEAKGNLRDINERAKRIDANIAIKIMKGEINALISVSSDPNKVNEKCIIAAIEKNIPIVGTGGTSISTISLNGANVIGSSGGSVATTSMSRGVSFAASLASYWKLQYIPSDNLKSVKIQSIIGASVPILLISSLSKFFINKLQEQEGTRGNDFLQALLSGITRIVPTVITMISCQESSQLYELSLISGGAVGSMANNGVIVSILVGVICGWMLTYLLALCSKYHFLPTSTTIISIGLSVIVSGSISIFLNQLLESYSHLLQPTQLLHYLNDFIATKISREQLLILRSVLGSILGYLSSLGSEYGYYHTVMLPLIALDMECGDFSFFGAMDLVTLCAPCGGICLGIYLLSCMNRITLSDDKKKLAIHTKLGLRGFFSNVLFGDFVEACYPYSLEYTPILISIRIACILSGALLGLGLIRSSAYLPLPLALYVSYGFNIKLYLFHVGVVHLSPYTLSLLAFILAFFLPFITTTIYFFRRKVKVM